MSRDTFRWVGLTRVSTSGQVENGGGLDTQQAAIEAFVKGRGDRLVTVLCDAGVSGTLEAMNKRLALAEALQMLNRNEADGIVVAKLDRLGRELAVQEIVMSQIRKFGCKLASCDVSELDVIETDDDPTRRMLRQILAVFADYERLMIISRTQAGKQRKKREGGWLGNRTTPYGYELDGMGGLREVAYEINAIAVARTMRAMKATYAVIGEYLVQSGVRLRRGTQFRPVTVRQILVRASENDYPKPAELDNLAKLLMGMPTDSTRV